MTDFIFNRDKDDNPVCPVCGQAADYFYDDGTDVIGCSCCINREDADDVLMVPYSDPDAKREGTTW